MFDFHDARRRLLLHAGIGGKGDFLAEAEAHRLAGQYGEAAKAFRLHLIPHSEDAAIWLELGRVQYAAGAVSDAEASLRKSISIASAPPESHVALARLLHDTGRPFGALVQYRLALRAAPDLVLDPEDLARTGSRFLQRRGNDTGGAVYCDVSDLLVYLRDNLRVTGIQRVELSIISECFRSLGPDNLAFVFCREGESRVFGVADEQLAALVDVTGRTDADLEAYKHHLDIIYRDAVPIELKRNDTFMILGAFWIGINYVQTYIDLKRRGIIIGAYIYDLIPLTHPQFIPQSALVQVQEQFAEILIAADFVCTISDFVAQEVRATLDHQLAKSIPVSSVPLAHDPPPRGDGKVDQAFRDQLPSEYVLCVGTLDERKNHLLLLEAWREICAKHGEQTPPLLLAGKWGWKSGARIEAFEKELEETAFLRGKIMLLGNLSDAKVDYLYRHCLFTVFPSFVEGWGLPVGESLACGKPCIASSTSSIPEVGGSLVRYIDPHNAATATQIIEKPLVDRADLAAWTAEVVRDFKPRTWDEVTDDLLDKIAVGSVAARDSSRPIRVLLEPGHIHEFGADALTATAPSWKRKLNRFVLSAGWQGIGSWGCWSTRPVAELEFATDLPVGKDVCVRLRLRSAPPRKAGTVILRDPVSGRSVAERIEAERATWVALHTQVGPGNTISLQIERTDKRFRQAEAARPCFIGVEAVAYD